MPKMKFSVSIFFLGLLALQIVEGRLEDSRFNEGALFNYTNELVQPLAKNTNKLNQTIQEYWEVYDQQIKDINSKFGNLKTENLLKKTKKVSDQSNKDSCEGLEEIMANAQNIVNNGTIVLVEVMQKMSVVIAKQPDCLSYNIFKTISCAAHKLRGLRNIFNDYKDELITNDAAAAKSLKQVTLQFFNCLERL